MTVGLDTTFLLYFFASAGKVGVPLDSNGKPIELAKERVEGLVAELEKTGTRIIVPTPALAEMMVRAGVAAGQSWIAMMAKSRAFRIAPFDEKAAVEMALMPGNSIKGSGLHHPEIETYAKLKYDRQIIAIARAEGATTFYTDDGGQRRIAAQVGLVVKGLADCIPPTTAAQQPLDLEPKGDDTKSE